MRNDLCASDFSDLAVCVCLPLPKLLIVLARFLKNFPCTSLVFVILLLVVTVTFLFSYSFFMSRCVNGVAVRAIPPKFTALENLFEKFV